MQGSIGVTSQRGVGSQFSFQVTLAHTTTAPQTRQNVDLIPINFISHLRILLVEDNPANQLVIKKVLEHPNIFIDLASNGFEAIQAAKDRAYDLILMDISMSLMDGMTATKHIRQLPCAMKYAPIIALTAHALQGDRERFMDAGMNDYLTKPIDKNNTLHCIARWANKKPKPELKQGINELILVEEHVHKKDSVPISVTPILPLRMWTRQLYNN